MYDREALLAATDLAALADDLIGGHVGTARSPMWTCPNPNHVQTGRTPPLSIFRDSAPRNPPSILLSISIVGEAATMAPDSALTVSLASRYTRTIGKAPG